MQVPSSFLWFLASTSILFLGNTMAESSHPHRTSPNITLPLPQKLIHQFPLPTWIENLAVRSNGEIITIHLGSNALYTVSPTPQPASVKLVATIPFRTSLFAIAELEHDIFYISAGNFSILTGILEPGSFCIFSVDFNHPIVKVEKVVELPDALLLNGMVALHALHKLLVPDSYKGIVWGVDVKRKSVEVAIDLPEMHAVGTAKAVGVNGIKVYKEWLYFTNSQLKSLFRVKFDARKGCVEGGSVVEKVASDEVFMDDFAVGKDGVVWVTTNAGGLVRAVSGEGGSVVTVAGKKGSLEVAGPTACAFGRGEGDRDVLYVVTTGGLGGGVDGGAKEGGKIVAVDTKGFKL